MGAKKEYYFGEDWFDVRPVSQNVTAIGEPLHGEGVVSYQVQDGGETVLIDTGLGLAKIAKVLRSRDTPVALTHTHPDHMGGASAFSKVSVFDHPFEKRRLAEGWKPREMTGFEPEFFAAEAKPPKKLSKTHFVPGVEDYHKLEDGDVIEVGGLTLRVFHTPGHTPGSVCYFIDETGELFTGDSLYPSMEYLHLPESSLEDYQESLEMLKEEIGDRITRIYPGHGARALAVGMLACRPSLLTRHIKALEGNGSVPLLREVRGEDFFGPYVERVYDGFSIAVKP